MKFLLMLTFLPIFLLSFSAQALPYKGSEFLISAACPYSTAAAENMAKNGGNAVDAALTALIVMSVTRPQFAAFGGGGFAIVKMNRKKHVLDFREMAPAKTHPEFYIKKGKKASREGGAAVGIPGIPAGIHELHKKFGKAPWPKLFEHAIDLAENGFKVSGDWVHDTNRAFKKMNRAAKKAVTNDKPRKKLTPGQMVKQKRLVALLKKVQQHGAQSFYEGDVAKDIVATISKTKGVMSLEDLKSYKVKWRDPLIIKKHGYTFTLMPPPSSGGIVIASALKLMDHLPLRKQKPRSADEADMMAKLLKLAYQGRSELGDPDFHKNPTQKLLSDKYLKQISKESQETSHLSVMTKNGDAVSMTFTLNSNYGSGLATNKYGIFLNNEMDDFTTRPNKPNQFGLIQGMGNKVEPGKRPLSSMSPTLVEKGRTTILAIGAPGGPRIISSTFQAIYRVLFNDMDIDTAIQTPRVHHQFLPNTVFYDKDRWSPEVIKDLESRGHKVKPGWQGLVYGVHNNDGILEGAYDSRGEGSISGF